MPIAYFPHDASLGEETRAVMDLLVTHDLRSHLVLAFRFYPYDDGYTSTMASTATFTTTIAVYEGSFLRISHDGIAGMMLQTRRRGLPWETIGRVATAPYIPSNASCLVYTTSAPGCTLEGICAIGLIVDGEYPVCIPETVLPCKYSIMQPAPEVVENFIYAATAYKIKTSWLQGAWQALKWGATWVEEDFSAYYDSVQALEDRIAVQLTPAQLVAIAYKPYYADTSPSFPGEVVCVVTERIPPSTRVFLYCTPWAADALPTYAWTTPAMSGIDAGTVVAFGGLGTTPRATYGSMTTETPPVSGVSMTAFTFTNAAYSAIAAVYSCSYRGQLPETLQPGVSILNKPWPSCPAILGMPSCKPICLWKQEAITLNNLCAIRWLCQPLPAFRCCSARRCCSCACGASPAPSTFTTTTPYLAGGC